MKKTDYFVAHHVDEHLTPLPELAQETSSKVYFKGTLYPALENGVTEIEAERFTYQSLTDGYTSVLGIEGSGANYMQLSVILRNDVKDGLHQLGGSDDLVQVRLLAIGYAYTATSGTVEFTRDAVDGSIKGVTFCNVERAGKSYKLSAKFFLLKTGAK